MAQTQVDDGSNPDAVDLAQTIEIQQMRDLLAAYYPIIQVGAGQIRHPPATL